MPVPAVLSDQRFKFAIDHDPPFAMHSGFDHRRAGLAKRLEVSNRFIAMRRPQSIDRLPGAAFRAVALALRR